MKFQGPILRKEIVSDEFADKAIKELNQACEIINKVAAKLKLNFKLDHKPYIKELKNKDSTAYAQWKEHLAVVQKGKYKGIPTETQIASAFRVIHRYIFPRKGEGKNNLYMWGGCQASKTMIMGLIYSFLPIVSQLHGKKITVLANLPNRKNIHTGCASEFDTIIKIFSRIKIEGHIFKDWCGNSLDAFVFEGESAKNADFGITSRNPSTVDRHVQIAEKCVQLGFDEIVVLIDEIHDASNKDGCGDKVYKILSERISTKLIGVSATPSEVENLADWTKLEMWLEPNYQGAPFYNGRELVTLDGKSAKPLPVLTIEKEFPELVKFKDFDFKEAGEHAKNLLAESIVEICQRKLKPGQIFFLRAFKTNEENDALYEKILAKSYSNFIPIKYCGTLDKKLFGDQASQKRTIKEVLIDEIVERQKMALVLAGSGRSRMGDSYPKECLYYMDFVENIWKWNTAIQGTFGRAHGIGKNSTCYFWSEYAAAVKEFIATKGTDMGEVPPSENGRQRPQRSYGIRDSYEKKGRSGRPSQTFTFLANLEIK